MNALANLYRKDKAALLLAASQPNSKSTTTPRSVKNLLHKLCSMTDATLRTLWDAAGFDNHLCLAAVGGYGRGELYPYSDVDVLLLMPDGTSPEKDDALKAQIEKFIGSCWDTGLEIGSSVRTVTECVQEASADITVQTSLLEARFLVGSVKLFKTFQKHYAITLDPKAFFVAKTAEMRQRHAKFENTPYSLEPNCKESPGGMRDLQVVLWVAKAAGLGDSWESLGRKGLATEFEVKQLKRNEDALALIRTRLHLASKRREDRLVFDLQHAVAQSSVAYTHLTLPTICSV